MFTTHHCRQFINYKMIFNGYSIRTPGGSGLTLNPHPFMNPRVRHPEALHPVLSRPPTARASLRVMQGKNGPPFQKPKG